MDCHGGDAQRWFLTHDVIGNAKRVLKFTDQGK
jgi:hypothetical protein